MHESSEEELKQRVLAAVRATPSPVRKRATLRVSALLASAVLFPVLGLAVAGGFQAGARPWSLIAITGVGLFVICFGSLWVALGTGGRMLGRPWLWLAAQAVLTPVLLFAWKVWSSSLWPGMTESMPERPGFRCLALTLCFGSWPLLALALLRRRSDPSHPRALGAALGVAVGSYAASAIEFWCPVGYAPHVLLGHALPIALLGVVGALIGHVLLALPRES